MKMQRILLGLGALVFVGALAAGATGAFFSDSETSTGNTFAAGSIDLKVDDTQHYDGLVCTNGQWAVDLNTGTNPTGTTTRPELVRVACAGTWAEKDLVPTVDKFFDFTDVKPGDWGENTISLHIDNNPAYACADITNIHNDENTNLQPEINAGDNTTGPDNGELGQSIDFATWNDNGPDNEAGNNVWDADEAGSISHGAPLAPESLTLADSSGDPIPATGDKFLGIAWCVGTLTGGHGSPLVCDGNSVGNQAQTDSYAADVGIRVVQSRNNGSFTCALPEHVD